MDAEVSGEPGAAEADRDRPRFRLVSRAGGALLVAGIAGAGVAYASAFLPGDTPVWAGALLAAAAVLAMTGTALLAVARPGAEVLAAVLGGGGVLLALGMVALWTIPAADPADPALVLGLPAPVAHLLYGIGLLPALAVPLVYALTFERATLSEEDLRRVRRAARAAATEAAADASVDAPDAVNGSGTG